MSEGEKKQGPMESDLSYFLTEISHLVNSIDFFFFNGKYSGDWVIQSVEHRKLDLGIGHNLMDHRTKLHNRLHAQLGVC